MIIFEITFVHHYINIIYLHGYEIDYFKYEMYKSIYMLYIACTILSNLPLVGSF
jgi:hypothetical protein